jgi:hypothetical protein
MKMDANQERALLHALERADGNEAREQLAAGRPIVYREPSTPAGLVVKKYLDGRRELVRFENGRELVVSALAAT